MPPIDFIEDEPKIDFQPAESAGDALSRYPDLPEPERRKRIYSDYLKSKREDLAAQGPVPAGAMLSEAMQEPLVTPEDVRKFIFLPDAKPGGIREGIEKSVSSLISAPTTPAIGAAMALTPIAPQVMLAWAYQGLKDVPEAIAQTVTGETPSEKVQGGLRTAMDLLMLHGGTKARPLRLTEPELATLDQVDKARVMPPKVSPMPRAPLSMADLVEREAQRSVAPKIDFIPDKPNAEAPKVTKVKLLPAELPPVIAPVAPSPVSEATLDRLEAEAKAPETKPLTDIEIAYQSILEKQGKPAADAYAERMKKVGEWHPSANLGIEPPQAEPPKFKVTQDDQPYGVFSNEQQANMVASGLSGQVEVSPVTETGAIAEIRAEKEAASLADEGKVVPWYQQAIDKVEGKEPWMVTKQDYSDSRAARVSGQSVKKTRKLAELVHKGYVRDALTEGKPVPTEVLADYPDLKPSELAAEAKAQGEQQLLIDVPKTPRDRTQQIAKLRQLADTLEKAIYDEYDSDSPRMPLLEERQKRVLAKLNDLEKQEVSSRQGTTPTQPTHLPGTNIPTPEEGARWDKVTEENRPRVEKLSDSQLSQVAIEVGIRPMQASKVKLFENVHPDDLKAALDKVAPVEPAVTAREARIERVADEIYKVSALPEDLAKYPPERRTAAEAGARSRATAYATKLVTAIETKDLAMLENALHVGNKISRQAFERETGIKLGNTTASIKEGLKEWYGEKAYDEYHAQKEKARSEKEAAEKEASKQRQIEEALKKPYRYAMGGSGIVKTVTAKDMIDDLVKNGFINLKDSKRGAFKTLELSNEAGTSYEFRSKAEMNYVREAAAKKAAEAKAAQEKQQSGLTGMGAAVPSEFVPSGKATAVKNAAVDAERQSRGQPPILAPQRLKNAVVWDRVMAKIDREPEWQDRLIADLQENPRTPSQDEILALDHRYVDLQNEYAKATRDGAQAYSDRRMEDVQDAKARAAIFERQLSELEQVARKVGTEWGRSGQMRQRLMKEDFTLAAMESRWRAAKNFEPLTEKEHTEIAELQRKIALADQKAIEATARFNERIAILEAQKALAEAKALAQPAYEPRILQAAERFAKAMEKKGDEAMARIKARLGRTSAGVDPTILSDVGIVGAAKLTRGLVDFAKWTDAMARDIGEWIREHAQEAWDASQKVFNENLEGFNKGADKATADKVKKATDLPGRISATRTAIAEKAAKGAGSPLHTEVRKLVRLLIEQDRTMSRDAVIDTVHGILKESMPEITRLEAMDAISGRGKFWTPPKDEVSKRVRDLATQIRLIGHQIDVEAKRPLPRTGYQPDKFSDAARKEQQKLNDLKRQYGVVVTDPNAQLASVLQAIKTRLLNERKDLQERLTKGDFSPRRKLRDVPLDAEAAKAKAEVLLLREKFQKGLDHQRYLLKSSAEKAWLGIKEGLNLSRAILTSWDVSAVFRQGGVIALGNPLRAARSLGPMFRALASEKNAAAIEAEILSRPNAKLYAQSKLFLAPREGAHLSGMEEAFMSRLASKIPGVAGSGRAYITFLNRLRADTFDAMHADLTAKTPTELQAISNYINVATGRGNLGKVAGAAETLSTVFFAPRLVASRFQLLAAEPLYRGSAQTRYLVAKEYAKFLGGLAVIYGLGKLAGATVQTDPRSTDFGKLKFGNTRVDPLSGLSQVTVLLSRLGSGKMMNAKGQIEPIRGKVKFGHSSSADLIARFLRSKLSPWIGNTIDVLAGKNVVGETVTPGSVAVNMTVPLALRDIYDVMKEQGIAEGTIISILSLFGMSIQNYDAHKKPK